MDNAKAYMPIAAHANIELEERVQGEHVNGRSSPLERRASYSYSDSTPASRSAAPTEQYDPNENSRPAELENLIHHGGPHTSESVGKTARFIIIAGFQANEL